MKTTLNWLLLLVLAAGGCTTKSAARANARARSAAAYQAGRAEAYQQILETQRTSIRVIGHVNIPDIPWKDGLTLTEVIVDADCTDQGDPHAIFITRKGVRYPVDVKGLLGGEDFPMEPGDTVEINP